MISVPHNGGGSATATKDGTRQAQGTLAGKRCCTGQICTAEPRRRLWRPQTPAHTDVGCALLHLRLHLLNLVCERHGHRCMATATCAAFPEAAVDTLGSSRLCLAPELSVAHRWHGELQGWVHCMVPGSNHRQLTECSSKCDCGLTHSALVSRATGEFAKNKKWRLPQRVALCTRTTRAQHPSSITASFSQPPAPSQRVYLGEARVAGRWASGGSSQAGTRRARHLHHARGHLQ